MRWTGARTVYALAREARTRQLGCGGIKGVEVKDGPDGAELLGGKHACKPESSHGMGDVCVDTQSRLI
jgi:hypothetical protein